jgi:hypothetical protein
MEFYDSQPETASTGLRRSESASLDEYQAFERSLVRKEVSALVLAFVGCCANVWMRPAVAAEDTDADALAKKLSNPVAALISVPFQLNWDTGLAANGLGDKVLLNVQPVIPIELSDNWNVISRTIIPFAAQSNVVPGDSHQSGLGDITQSFFFTPTAPLAGGWILGAGPALLLPTATDSALGNGKWGIGPTLVALKQTPSGWTYGVLWNHIWSIAGSSNRPDLNATYLQPFLSKGMGKGLTLGANVESTYDWEGHNWVVPFNLTVSQVLKLGTQLVSVGGGVRYYIETPPGGPHWGLRVVFTLLFPK